MIADFINRAFGRVSLHGVAWVRHATLTAATCSKQHTAGHSSSSDGHAGGGANEKAWDLTSDRAQAGSPTQRET